MLPSAPSAPSAPASPSQRRMVLTALMRGASAGALGWIGDRTVRGALHTVQVASMIGHGVGRLTFGISGLRAVTRRVLVRQILFTAVEALPFTSLIATLLGLSVVLQAQLNLMAAGQTGLLGKLLVIAIVRELGPLVAALVLIGRSGTAMVVEMANMRVSGELDSLERMGVDVFEYLVVPRLGATAISLACVSIYFVVVSLATGLLAGQLLASNSPGLVEFIELIAAQLRLVDLAAFAAKTLPLGLVIAAIACLEGLSAGPDITDVPRAATRGTVAAISVLFVWNALVSGLVFLV